MWRDVQNSSASSSSGFGVGFGVNFGSAETEAGKDVAARYPGTLTPIVNMPAREGDEGTTRATVTPGTLELSDQRQDLASLNRDAGAAHVSVEAYDIARLKARQEGAAALSELLNGLTGDLSVKIGLKDGDPAKAALHAAVGAAVAAVAGTDIGAGAAAGLVSELANGVVSQMLKDHPELTTAQTDAIRQWTATALGAAIGGQAGAAAALDNIKHNYLSHVQLEEFKEKLLACGGDPACEQEVGAEYRDLSRSQNEELLDAISASDLDVLWNAYKSGNSADLYESILKSLGPDSEAAAIFYDVFWKGAVVQTGSGTQGYFTEIAFFTIRDILAERLLAGNPDASLSDLARLAQLELGEDVLSPQLGQIIGAVASVRYSKAKQSNAGQNSNDTEPSNGSAFPDSKQNAGQGQGDKAGGGATGSNSRQWDNWQPPAGYTRNADGTVTHNGSGQLYTPVRDASGNVRFDSRGNPVFNTQSAGSTAQTTLTQPSTSGPVINAPGPTRLPVPDDLPTNIHMGQQGKHIRGHNNFQEGRSYFNHGIDPSELLAGVHNGQYPVVGTGARGNPIVEFGRPIGVDGRTGQVVTRGQIHYGNNGAHIVPDGRN